VTVDDVFFRVGGAEAGTVANAFVDNSNNSIIDDSWIQPGGLDVQRHPGRLPRLLPPSSVTSFTGYGMGSYSFFDPRPRTSPPNARTPVAAALRGCGAISGDRRQPGR
jgi:hypothetical protein